MSLSLLRNVFLTACCAVLAGCGSVPLVEPVHSMPAAPAGTTLVIRGVTVIDTERGHTGAPQDVFIAGERIAMLRPASTRSGDVAGVRMVDGTGKFLIPGLWDMHAHWWDEGYLPLFTLNGVTGIRQMRGYTVHHAWRTKGIEGTPAAPRMVLASPLVDGVPPMWTPSLEASIPAEARAAVQLVVESDADFLKVYDKVPRDAYLALLDEALRLGVRVEGHVPTAVSWQEAARRGVQRSFEHLNALETSAADDAQALSRRWVALQGTYSADAGPTPAQRQEATILYNHALDHFDASRFAELKRDLAKLPIWMVPTLVLRAARVDKFKPEIRADPRLAQLPPWILEYWKDSVPEIDDGVQGDIDVSRRRLAYYLERTRELHDAGVPMLVGSDTGIPYVFPGTSVHEEMQLMAKAGLAPLAVLQAATRNVGRFLERDDIGTIKEGALADLVLLDANPLTDIAHVQRIAAVAIGGQWIDGDARRAGFDALERRAAAPTVTGAVMDVFKAEGLDAAMAAYSRRCPSSPEVLDCDPGMLLDAMHSALGEDSVNKDRQLGLINWAQQLFVDNAQVQEWAAELHWEGGRRDEARMALARAMALARGAPWLMRMQESFGEGVQAK
jgi:imidazolonepropionase-like amidohydrolase